MKLQHFMVLILLLALGLPGHIHAQSDGIYIMTVSDAIGPAVADFIERGVRTASRNDAECLIIRLNTPGGLADSMRDIVMTILGSPVPVVVFVAPSGARAASAGVMITMAADIAAMAPGTNIGAAHPVGAGGENIEKAMSEKVINDMVAHARSVAQKRGRNAEWVEKAIRESVSVTETQALEENIINVVARDTEDLIRQINGMELAGKGVLDLEGAEKRIIEEDLRTKILKTISNPNIAYILMMLGLAGIYFELSNPGAIFPGVIGGISLILAFFAFQTLPVNYAGILLIVVALILFILEMKIASYGLLSIAGVASFLLGSLMLFNSSGSGMRISWSVLLPTVTLVSAFFVVVAGLVFRVQISRPVTGSGGLVGEIGVVKKALTPEGKVLVHGEIWKAVSNMPIEEGTRVKVVKVQNLTISVEPVKENTYSG
ncbi:MAG: nodulation protein NfeD [Desulfobacterales bacterium]